MHALSSERILIAWERGLSVSEPWRPLALLETAVPQTQLSDLASLPLAERNSKLLELRSISFGRIIEAFAKCPHCDAPLEFELKTDALRHEKQTAVEDHWMEADTEMYMRLANTADLAAVRSASTDDEARTLLLARTMGRSAAECDADDHPEWVERFERLNAPAEQRCVLTCDSCAGRAEIDFDIAGFFWREVATAAHRLLAEIHRLASAYGWSEGSILAMSPARRCAYLEMLNA